MILDNVILLAVDSARTRSYVQALAAENWAPEVTLLYGPPSNPDRTWPTWPAKLDRPSRIPIANLSEPARTTMGSLDWEVEDLEAQSVNDDLVLTRLRELRPKLVLFSGSGGEIVNPDLLQAGGAFLHAHSGWLPEMRGSTTTYYSILQGEKLGVSALLLDRNIDTGPILLRRRFELPPPEVDIDYLYDSAIRAAVIIEVIDHLVREGTLPTPLPRGEITTPFYVIHPVLKHLAILHLTTDQSRTEI